MILIDPYGKNLMSPSVGFREHVEKTKGQDKTRQTNPRYTDLVAQTTQKINLGNNAALQEFAGQTPARALLRDEGLTEAFG